MLRKENGEVFASPDGSLDAAPVPMENIGRSVRSLGGSIPSFGDSIPRVPGFEDSIPSLGDSIPNAVADNSAAGVTLGGSASLRSKEGIGLYARALETNLATRSRPFGFSGATRGLGRNGSGAPTATS